MNKTDANVLEKKATEKLMNRVNTNIKLINKPNILGERRKD